MTQPLFDSHCHIDLLLEKGANLDDILKDARQNGVSAAMQIAADPDSYVFSRDFCSNDHGIDFYYTVGAHPNEAHELDTDRGLAFARENIQDAKFKAIGEIGLDYFYGPEHRLKQIEVFEQYLELAGELNKPVCIHTREAYDDTLQILKNLNGKLPVLIHCFTGDRSQMESYLELGAYISFSGIVTFKNAADIQDAARFCPADRMLVETDAPYLAPVPNRGKINMPGWTRHVVSFLEELTGRDLAASLFENTLGFYRI